MTDRDQARRFKEESYRARQYRLKSGSNRFLYTFLIVFVLGYVIFFSSRLWLPATYVGVEVTQIGQPVTENEREITIESWTYAREEQRMEILLEIRSNVIDETEDYSFGVRNKEGAFPVKKILQDEDLYVLHVSNIPKDWTEVSLRIEGSREGSGQEGAFDSVILYMNDKEATEVRHIEEKSQEEYLRIAIEQKIKGDRKNIRELKKENWEINDSITAADKKIAKIKEEMGYQTPAETEDSMDDIDSLERMKKDFQEERKENEKEIEELENKISLKKQKLKEQNQSPGGKESTGNRKNNGGEQG